VDAHDFHGFRNASQMEPTEADDFHLGGPTEHGDGGGRRQDLPAAARTHDARCKVHDRSEVVAVALVSLARV
jgi:hypothetical protein